jgi:hypothetical protein
MVLANGQAERSDGKCNRKIQPSQEGNGEMVRQERTSAAVMRRLGKPHPEQRQNAQTRRPADAQVGG